MDPGETARACPRCDGDAPEGCPACTVRATAGLFERPDLEALRAALVAKAGPNRGTFRTSQPLYTITDLLTTRCYVVWHLAMGDTAEALPPTARFLLDSDPWAPELQALAQNIKEHGR